MSIACCAKADLVLWMTNLCQANEVLQENEWFFHGKLLSLFETTVYAVNLVVVASMLRPVLSIVPTKRVRLLLYVFVRSIS